MESKLKNKKIFSLGAIISLVIGILLAGYFIWAYPMFKNETVLSDFTRNFNKLFYAYLLGIATSFIGIYASSKKYYEKNHIWRALLYAPASFISWTIYNVELNDNLYRQSDRKNEKFWRKRNAWYGITALLVVILGIGFIFWYAIRFYGVVIF